MAANSIVLQGNVVRDPELRYTPQGTAVCEITIAHNEKKDEKDNTLFLNATTWDKTATFVSEWFKKGDPIIVEGRLVQENYEKDGKKRSVIKMVANRAHFCGGKSNERSGSAQKPQRNDPSADDSDVPF